MSAVGTWTLHYSWGCTGTYGNTTITFNANGTFAAAPYTGKWSENAGKILWKYDQAPSTVYGGDEVSNAMLGIQNTFAGATGCWYALRVGTTAPAAAAKSDLDSNGVKTK